MDNDENKPVPSKEIVFVKSDSLSDSTFNRRNFLIEVLKQTGKITLASGVLYGTTYLISNTSNTAGAK